MATDLKNAQGKLQRKIDAKRFEHMLKIAEGNADDRKPGWTGGDILDHNADSDGASSSSVSMVNEERARKKMKAKIRKMKEKDKIKKMIDQLGLGNMDVQDDGSDKESDMSFGARQRAFINRKSKWAGKNWDERYAETSNSRVDKSHSVGRSTPGAPSFAFGRNKVMPMPGSNIHDQEIDEDDDESVCSEYASEEDEANPYNQVPSIGFKALPQQMMDGQLPLVYLIYVQFCLELLFLLLLALIFIVLHSPIWWLMFIVVGANFTQTLRYLCRLEHHLDFDVMMFKHKWRMIALLDTLLTLFWILQDKWAVIISAEYRGEGLSLIILLMKFAIVDFVSIYAVWSYVVRKWKLVDEQGRWIKSKKERREDRERTRGKNLQEIWSRMQS